MPVEQGSLYFTDTVIFFCWTVPVRYRSYIVAVQYAAVLSEMERRAFVSLQNTLAITVNTLPWLTRHWFKLWQV